MPVVVSFVDDVTAAAWTNQPSSLTELLGTTTNRTKYDLTNVTQARIVVNLSAVSASSGAELRVQYSTDQSTWNYLDGGTGPSVNVGSGSAGLKVSSFVNLVVGAKADVYLRVVGVANNSSGDPAFTRVEAQIK